MFNHAFAKSLRKKIGLNQSQLADLCEVHSVTISNWERGKKQPEAKNIQRLSEIFHVSVDALMSPTNEKKAPANQTASEGSEFNNQNENSKNNCLPIYNYSDICKSGINIAVSSGKLPIIQEVVCDGGTEELFAIRQNMSFRLGRLGFQDVPIIVLSRVSEIVEEGKIYLVSYNGETSLRCVTRIPPAGYKLANDDGELNVAPEFILSGAFTVLGKVVWFVVKK